MATIFNKATRNAAKKRMNKLVMSYNTLRNFLGFAALSLTISLIVVSFCDSFKSSYSDYYYSYIGDIIIALLCLQGATLIIYNGYNPGEQLISTVAGILAILIAVLPTKSRYLCESNSVHSIPREPVYFWNTELHTIFAGIFLILLGVISLVWFTKTDNKKRGIFFFIKILFQKKDSKKKWRNFIYVICGLVIFISVIVMIFYLNCKDFKNFCGKVPVIFCGESLAFIAYSVSWLTKGETFFHDKRKKHWIVRGLIMAGLYKPTNKQIIK